MNFSPDVFIRTTEKRHYAACQALWEKLVAAGDIYLGKYTGWYSVRDEAFYADGETEVGTDGKRRAGPVGNEVEWVEEPSYFFKLSTWGDRLLEFYDKNPRFIAPESRRNEVISFVKSGLQDLSVSRTSFSWGVPVPGDSKHIMYVWLDALTNYITAVGYPDEDSESFKTFWPADLHMVGKDILRFHAVYWPAFLMAAGVAPPKRVFAHGWWTNEGQKISKSLGNVIDPFEIVQRYGLDQARYFLLREVPFGNDGDFSRRAIIGRSNNDLANDFGNLAQRVLAMVAKNCGGAVPQPGAFTAADEALLGAARGLVAALREAYDVQAFHRALEITWEIVAAANRYVDEQAPWALRTSDPARMATVLYVVLETVRHLAILTQPVMPGAMAQMLDQLGQTADRRSFADLAEALAPGTALPAPQGVFPRLLDETAA
jgi:methionyl-tRNA synthetase